MYILCLELKQLYTYITEEYKEIRLYTKHFGALGYEIQLDVSPDIIIAYNITCPQSIINHRYAIVIRETLKNTDEQSALLGERVHSCDITRVIDLDMANIVYPCSLFSQFYKSVISRQAYHNYVGSHFMCMAFTD